MTQARARIARSGPSSTTTRRRVTLRGARQLAHAEVDLLHSQCLDLDHGGGCCEAAERWHAQIDHRSLLDVVDLIVYVRNARIDGDLDAITRRQDAA